MFFSQNKRKPKSNPTKPSLLFLQHMWKYRKLSGKKKDQKKKCGTQIVTEFAHCLVFVCWCKPLANLTLKNSFPDIAIFSYEGSQNWSLFYTCRLTAPHIIAALPCPPTSMQQPRNHSDLSGVQKTFLHLCQLLPSLATHFKTSNIEIKQAFSHLWQVTTAGNAMLSADCNRCLYFWKITQALQGNLEYMPVLLSQGQGCPTCPSSALVGPGETASRKACTVYSDGLNRMKFAYRSWTLQVRPQNCIMVRTKSRLVS